jgi:hypothetical protein
VRCVPALLVAGVALAAAGAQAQGLPGRGPIRRNAVRTLGARPAGALDLGYGQLLARHLDRVLGGRARLPAAVAPAPAPGVYVTVTAAAALVYDRPVARLERGRFPRSALAACTAPAGRSRAAVRCAAAVQAAAQPALAEEGARLAGLGRREPPSVLFLAERELPFQTFLDVAYAAALGTAGGPPPLRLAVAARGRLGAVAFFLVPPHAIRLPRGTTPLVLMARVGGGRVLLETSGRLGVDQREVVASLAALERLAGEIKARDPDRSVAFVVAEPGTPLGEVVAVMERLRAYYPNLVLGATPPRFAGRRGE